MEDVYELSPLETINGSSVLTLLCAEQLPPFSPGISHSSPPRSQALQQLQPDLLSQTAALGGRLRPPVPPQQQAPAGGTHQARAAATAGVILSPPRFNEQSFV